MISRFVVVLVFGSFGLAVARESQLQGSLFIGFEDWSLTVRDIVNYGVLPGLVLGLINYFFFFTYRYSPLVVPRIRDMQSIYDSFVVSLDSGMAEESCLSAFHLVLFLVFVPAPVFPPGAAVARRRCRFCQRPCRLCFRRCCLRWCTTSTVLRLPSLAEYFWASSTFRAESKAQSPRTSARIFYSSARLTCRRRALLTEF